MLREKDKTGVAARDIIAMLERQSGLKTQCLRSDNGSKFVNSMMTQFCQKNSVIHETTILYLPEQNGIAERAIAVFFEMVCCMLWSAGVDLKYWSEAFTYVVHIRNLTLTSRLKGIVPHEAWTGRKADVSHLQIFGSLGWAHVPKQVRKGKLESRTVKVHLLGWWNDEAKGYRLEDLENDKLIASRDVHFFKDDSSSDLAIIDIRTKMTPSTDINNLVDNAIADKSLPTILSHQKLTNDSLDTIPMNTGQTPPDKLPQ